MRNCVKRKKYDRKCPDWPLLLKCTKFDQLILRKIIKIVATDQMPDFDAKMHQNRFRLRLRPRPRWVSLQRSPRSPSWI